MTKIKLLLDTEYKKTAPTCSIRSSMDMKEFVLNSKHNEIDCEFELLDDDFINIQFTNKDDTDDNVIIIRKIVIDEIDIQHYIYHGSFEPIYNMDWYNKQVVKPPKVYRPCTELRHNGTWKLKIKKPIWKMMLENWMNDER